MTKNTCGATPSSPWATSGKRRPWGRSSGYLPATGTLTCGQGICEVTVPACAQGQPGNCVPGTPNPSGETCDGTDDNCDGQVDEGCSCVSGAVQPCYTGDPATRNVGQCQDGTQTCSVLGVWGACIGDVTPTAEICNGLDDDCDPSTNDGSEDPQLGVACDGGDSDLCNEGTIGCQGGSPVCSDNTGDTLDVCNGQDDDCDAASADGSEDPQMWSACDGADTDLCLEGVYTGCSGGQLVCSDTTSSTTEICGNEIDDDCDPATPDDC